MDDDKTLEERAAEELAADLKRVPRTIAEMRGTAYGMESLSPDQELWAWGFEDEAVDVPGMLAQGHSLIDVAKMRYPLRERLMNQAGTTFDEQRAYADRVAARWLAARAKGRPISPPKRPPQTLKEG